MSAPDRIRSYLAKHGKTVSTTLIQIAGGENPSSTISRMFQRGELERELVERRYFYCLSKRYHPVSASTTRKPKKQATVVIEPRADVLQKIHSQHFETVEEWMARTGQKPEILASFTGFGAIAEGDDDE